MREKVFPQLYALNSVGRIKIWQIRVVEHPDGTVFKITTFGLLNGKLQVKPERVASGKNLDKANRTTPWGQALFEAQSDHQRKLDKKYTEQIPGTAGYQEPDIRLPMLAHNFRERSHNILFPAYAQTKLNGVRCLAKKVSQKEVEFTSRKGKHFLWGVTAHLVQPLLQVMELGEIFDGELYVHEWTFQQIVSTTKKVQPWCKELQFHIFDIADPAVSFSLRWKSLVDRWQRLPQLVNEGLYLVDCLQIPNADCVKIQHDEFVKAGYEGVIIRNEAGLYVFDHRSKDLQKYKEFIDEEFIIVGLAAEIEIIIDPITKEETRCVVFECFCHHVPKDAPEKDKLFECRPRGTVAYRAKLYQEIDQLVGKQLTVRYQELSSPTAEKAGFLPIFPVGIAIRDYE